MSINRNQLQFLFVNARFNSDQIDKIGLLCQILGKYMFLDRPLLKYYAGDKIGLSYIKRAVTNDIITEMQFEDAEGKNEIFYYQLGVGGRYLLEQANLPIYRLNILATKEDKGRILTFNYFAMENALDLSFYCNQDAKYRFFICNGDTVCYFPDEIKKQQIISFLIKELTTTTTEEIEIGETIKKVHAPSKEEKIDKFDFIEIDMPLIEIGAKTKTTKA